MRGHTLVYFFVVTIVDIGMMLITRNQYYTPRVPLRSQRISRYFSQFRDAYTLNYCECGFVRDKLIEVE